MNALWARQKSDDFNGTTTMKESLTLPRPFKLQWGGGMIVEEVSIQCEYRSRVFPGFWIHEEALLDQNSQLAVITLNEGLASPEHAEFAERLAARRR